MHKYKNAPSKFISPRCVCVHCAWLKWRVRFERVSKASFLWSIAAIIWVSTTGWNPFLRSILFSFDAFFPWYIYEIWNYCDSVKMKGKKSWKRLCMNMRMLLQKWLSQYRDCTRLHVNLGNMYTAFSHEATIVKWYIP